MCHMCDHFVLLGPGQQKKRGKGAPESEMSEIKSKSAKESTSQTSVELLRREDEPLPSLPEDVA